MSDNLTVERREQKGSRAARQLRRQGKIPAVLYGHGEANISLSVTREDLGTVLRHHAHVVDLKGAVTDKALIREIQWDTWGIEVVHVNFCRVSERERVEIPVPVHLRGTAPGASEGGIINQPVHELTISCPATAIPEDIVVNINNLHLGQAVTVAELDLPEGATALLEADQVVVQCIEPVAAPVEEVEEGAEATEPEVIRRKEEVQEEGGQ